jgi:hypothetical protein
MSLDAPEDAHGPRPPQKHAGGRPPRRRLLSTTKFRELCIKHGPRALEIIAEIVEHGEPDLVRLAAAKYLIERGYGENPSVEGQGERL